MTSTLHEHICTVITISLWVLLRMKNISGEFVGKNIFRKSCRLINTVGKCGGVGEATDNHTMQCMRFACWITKGTDTHSEYVILLLFHFQNGYTILGQWYVCTYTYIASLVLYYCNIAMDLSVLIFPTNIITLWTLFTRLCDSFFTALYMKQIYIP